MDQTDAGESTTTTERPQLILQEDVRPAPTMGDAGRSPMETITEIAGMSVIGDEMLGNALRDFRQALERLTVEQMDRVLETYYAKRQAVRDWLRSHMVKGVHFGTPPGCEVTTRTLGDGRREFQMKWKDKTGSWKEKWVPFESYTPKESLYKPGAELVCDLMKYRVRMKIDMDAWVMLGKPADTFIVRCKLYTAAKEFVGEGMGVRKVGQKGGDANNALKMAEKCAQVDAVLRTNGLSDLFTQDIEDMDNGAAEKPVYAGPVQTPEAARAVPRDKRVTQTVLDRLWETWVADQRKRGAPDTDEEFFAFCSANGGVPVDDCQHPDKWHKDQMDKCIRVLLDRVHPETPHAPGTPGDDIPY